MSRQNADQKRQVPYSVKFTNDVVDFITQNIWSKRVYNKLMNYVDLLAYFPELGTPYHPDYPAARPPFPCRAVAIPDTPFTLYYITNEDKQTIIVIYMENQASDPNERFNWEIISF